MQFGTTLSIKQLLRIDGIGALLSTILLAGVVAQWPAWFGMPPTIVYILAGIAAIFALYDWIILACVPHPSLIHLSIITLANGGYALNTLYLLLWYRAWIQPLGYVYFLGEIGLLLVLIRLEWRSIIPKD